MRHAFKTAALALALLGPFLAACAPAHRDAPAAQSESHAMPVAEAQAGLTRLGFRPGPVDGAFGPRTAAAVTDYQRLRGLPVTGRIDDAFASSLGADLAALPRRPAADARVARAPAAGDVPPPDAAADPGVPDPALAPPDPAADPAPAGPAPDTDYRQSGHDPSLVAATETRTEQLGEVRYAEIDLDGDGDLDVIWNNTSTLYCGTAGCSFDIYLREGSGWRPVARLLAFEVDAAPGRTRGVRDILVTGRRGSALWQWNGRHYAPAG
ncbi:MAG: peptidoglycan-binding domain-containing protein [Thermohalobaculum sp.]|nr:peptidoglycan-binding domain-containing protein [Thermohalobaculum sp.]